MIRTEMTGAVAAATLHELLVDSSSWALWSPHVARLDTRQQRVVEGWFGETRAFFSPFATGMIVDEVRPGGGYHWYSVLGPWRLDYDNAVRPAPGGATVTFTARLSGPAAGLLERLVAPFSARGQRRRMERLIALAELLETGHDATPDRADVLEHRS